MHKSSNDSDASQEYEEDFETSHALEESKPEAENDHLSNSPALDSKAKKPDPPKYRPNDVFKTEIAGQKKGLKALEKENHHLRSALKALNDEITHLVESTINPTSKKPPSMPKAKSKRSSASTQEKKVAYYEVEFNQVKETYDKFNDVNSLMAIKNEVKTKEVHIAQIEKEMKKTQASIEAKQKHLDTYTDREIPENKSLHKQLMNEKIEICDLVHHLELAMKREQQQHSKNIEKEEELKEKYEKLQAVSKVYLIIPPNSNPREKEEHKKHQHALSKLEKISASSKTQLKIHEHDLKLEKESIDRELRSYQQSIKKKAEVLAQVRAELEEVIEIASASNLDKLAILIKSIQRPGSVKHSLSPRSGRDRNSRLMRSKEASTGNLLKPVRNLSSKERGIAGVQALTDRVKSGAGDLLKEIEGTKKWEVHGGKIEGAGSREGSRDKRKKEEGDRDRDRDSDREQIEKPLDLIDKAKITNNYGEKIKSLQVTELKLGDIQILEELPVRDQQTGIKGYAVNSGDIHKNTKAVENKYIKPTILEDLDSDEPKKSVSNAELTKYPEIAVKKTVKPSIFEELDSESNNLNFQKIELVLNEPKLASRIELFQNEPKVTAKVDVDLDEIKISRVTSMEPEHKHEVEDLFKGIELPDPKQKRNRDHLFQ